MKRRQINLIRCLLTVSLLLFGTMPCQAIPLTPSMSVASMEELLGWYGDHSDDALQECFVSKPIVCTGEVILDATPRRVDIIFSGGLHVPADARLTISNPNLVLMGPPPAITVEPGGVLHVRDWNMLTAQAMPQGGIVVQAGGTLLVENGITLPDGVVIDQNPPPNNLLPPATTSPPEPETPDETSPPETPGEISPPETPSVEEKLSIKGEVLKVTADRVLFAMVTLPYVDPALTETIVIERSADTQAWNAEYIFRWDENGLHFKSDQANELGIVTSRNRIDGSKTDFWYLARLSDKPFYLRVILTATDGTQTVSDEIRLTEPPIGQNSGSDDYESSGGNRGGGGQGTTEREDREEWKKREEQKETVAFRPGSAVTAKPQITPQTLAETAIAKAPRVSTTPPQKAAFTAQSIAEQQTTIGTEEAVLTAQASPPAQKVQTRSETNKPLHIFVRNGLTVAATLALCGGIWIITTKRKKS